MARLVSSLSSCVTSLSRRQLAPVARKKSPVTFAPSRPSPCLIQFPGALLNQNCHNSRCYSPASQADQVGFPPNPSRDAPVSSEISALWSALRMNKVVFKAADGSVIDGTPDALSKGELARAVVVELPPGVAWLHKDITTESSRFLFLRKAAFDIVALIFDHFGKGRAGIVVIGTPGIGKSWLANLLLVWAAQHNVNVIFEGVEKDIAYVFSAGEGTVMKIEEPRSSSRRPWMFADNRKTLYIVDSGGKGTSREPLDINAFTICLASPNEKHYGQFAKKPGVRKLMMPPWELREVEAIAPFASASIPDIPAADILNTLKQRYYEVGGVLRTLFLPPDDYSDKISAMKEDLDKLTQEQIDFITRKDQYWHKVPNDLFVLKPEAPAYNWRSCTVDLASDYLWSLLPSALDRNKTRALISALAATASYKSDYGAFRGKLLERVVKAVLPKGGSFSIRSLSDKEKAFGTLELPQLRLIEVWDVEKTVKMASDTYYLPTKSNQEHFDALFMLGDVLYLLQKTVSASREFPPLENTQKKDGSESPDLKNLLNDILTKIDKPKRPRQIRFVFVVDESVFQSFRLEKPPAPKAIDGIPLTVEVLKI